MELAADNVEYAAVLQQLREKFTAMMRRLHVSSQGAHLEISLLGEPETQGFITTHAGILDSSFERTPMSEAMRTSLQRSDYIFSGIKTFHELNEAFPSLIDENGNRKPFEQFLNDVRKIDEKYNKNYLRAEYNFCQQSANMASKWEEFQKDGDQYNLQYRTAGDDHVRPAHAALHGITLPPSHPFWQRYFPPNGWNCRCTVVQVRKSKYPQTPDSEVEHLISQNDSQNPKEAMFRFNPGMEQKTVPDYNPYTIRRCQDCPVTKGKSPSDPLNLSRPSIPDNELCEACKLLREKDTRPPYIETYNKEGEHLFVSSLNNEPELAENKRMASFFVEKMNEDVYLLPHIQPNKMGSELLRRKYFPEGVKEGKNPDMYFRKRFVDIKCMREDPSDKMHSKRNIQNKLRDAFEQADDAFLEIPVTYPRGWIEGAVKGKLNLSTHYHVVYVKHGDDLLIFESKKKPASR